MTLSDNPAAPSATDAAIAEDLLAFLAARTKRDWAPDLDLFADGGLGSLFAMELVLHIEKAHDVAIGGPDLRLDNFRTVTAMVALVHRLRAAVDG